MMQQDYVAEGVLDSLGDLDNHPDATQIVLHDASHISRLPLPSAVERVEKKLVGCSQL